MISPGFAANDRTNQHDTTSKEARMTWDDRFRQLEEGETILATDEVQNDDGSWKAALAVGQKAPCPLCTSHRVYRRANLVRSTA
jgi:hypothetical protein